MFLFNGSMFPFSFRVLVTLISVYTFSVCYFCGFVTFDLNIFLHLIKKKKELSVETGGYLMGGLGRLLQCSDAFKSFSISSSTSMKRIICFYRWVDSLSMGGLFSSHVYWEPWLRVCMVHAKWLYVSQLCCGTPPGFGFGWLCSFIYGCWNPVTWAPRHVYLLYDFCCVNAWFMHPGFTWNTMRMGPPLSSRGSWSLALSSGVLYNVCLACLSGLWSPAGFLGYLWHQNIWVPNLTDGLCFSRLFSSFVLVGSLFPLACYVHLYIWLAGFPVSLLFWSIKF
jgi:hypothetical protein